MSVWRILVALAVLVAAYVLGRAAGIVLDINPFVTQALVVACAVAVLVWTQARRRG